MRFITPITVVVAFAPLALVAAGCGAPQQKMVATKDDGIPANSASEQRLAMEGKAKPASAPVAEDPTQPLTTPMGGGDSTPTTTAPAGAATAKGGKGPKDAKGPKEAKDPKGGAAAGGGGSGGGKVSHAECKQALDKYIDLTLASDPRFEGIPQDMVAQLKEQAFSQAQSQKGDACATQEVTRSQYTCAMGATTTTAWQRCMK